MADKVKLGIIGVGQIGKRHIQRYQDIPEADIIAVADINGAEAHRVAELNNIPNVFENHKELLAMDEVEAVDVCVHNKLHRPLTIDSLRAGKHVYCEKPIADTYKDGLAMVKEAKRQKRKLSIQLFTLYTPQTRGAKRLIDDGQLGKIYYAKASYYRRRGRPFVDGYGAEPFVNTKTSGGGALLDMAVYHISGLLYLLGNPAVKTVSGSTFQETDMYEDRRKSSGYDVEELGVGFVRLEGGISIFVEEAWAIFADKGEGTLVFGSKGGLRLDPLSLFNTTGDMDMNATFSVDAADTRWHRCFPETEGYESAQKHWLWALLDRVPLVDSAGIALKTAQITEGMYRSGKLGREVTAEEIASGE